MNTIELDVLDRLMCIPALFPHEVNRVEYTHKNNIEKKIDIGSEEAASIELKQTENGGMTWKKTDAKPLSVEFTDLEIEFLKAQAERILKQLDENEGMRLPIFVLDFIYKKLKA